MQVQKIGCAVIRFKNRQVFRVQMLVPALSGVQREQEWVIGIVRVQQPQISEIEMAISWQGCEERIQKVVPLLKEQAVVHREDFVKLGTSLFDRW